MRTMPKNPTINGVQVEMDIYFDVESKYNDSIVKLPCYLYCVFDDNTDEVLAFGDKEHLKSKYYPTSVPLTEWGESSEPGYSVVTIFPKENEQ